MLEERDQDRICSSCLKSFNRENNFCPFCGASATSSRSSLERLKRKWNLEATEEWRDVQSIFFFYLLSLTVIFLPFVIIKEGFKADIVASTGVTLLTLIWMFTFRKQVFPLMNKLGLGLKGLCIVVAIWLITFAFAELLVFVLQRLFVMEEIKYLDVYIKSGAGVGGAIFFVCVIPAVVEEIAYRGIILGVLEKVLKPRDAILVSSAVFAIAHVAILTLPIQFFFGVYCAWLRVRTKSLYPGMIAHFGHNFMIVMNELYKFSPL